MLEYSDSLVDLPGHLAVILPVPSGHRPQGHRPQGHTHIHLHPNPINTLNPIRHIRTHWRIRSCHPSFHGRTDTTTSIPTATYPLTTSVPCPAGSISNQTTEKGPTLSRPQYHVRTAVSNGPSDQFCSSPYGGHMSCSPLASTSTPHTGKKVKHTLS